MRNIFDINGPGITFLTKVFDVFMLSVLWIVFSAPIITMGAATSGAYAVINKYIKKNEGYFWKTFWNTFVDSLKQHFQTWFVALLGAIILILDAAGFRSMMLSNHPFGKLYWVVLFLIVVYITWFFYLSAYIALIEGKTKEVLRYSFFMIVLHPIKTFVNTVLILMCIGAILSVPIAFIFAPGIMIFLTSFGVESVFAKHLPQEDAKRLLGINKTDEANEEN